MKLLALEHGWLTISDGSNRLVMSIEGLPFRFARDEHKAPRKPATLLVSGTEAVQREKFILESQMEMDFDGASYSERARKPSVWRFLWKSVKAWKMGVTTIFTLLALMN
ncbi:hypothetical protein M5J15_03170 [Serratia symbiotica]|uniref:hypothetical protein n=1 Tax=Serratia symbiotica TaxID=138074 RepID=UPI001DC37BA2|nr:hypothetical protein [Serratia symbiotica]MCX2957337.1 hypothetical protein [Serratia symbiotica]NIG87165.1 hypothetical protein [Serratia symbiotica]USS96141.1 hypothetical protein M5J15_03170 [Serratia symbiotica]